MKRGKKICETLKAIRSEIASANEIDYTPAECHHEGDCAGTCPKCESETRWLERQLRSRQALGKAVAIAGLSLALGSMTSCHHHKHYSLDLDESEESLECSTESGDVTAGFVDDSFFNSTSEDGDTTHQFTPLRGGDEDGVSFKDGGIDGDDDKYQVMGEVGVDENGNTYGLE
ncbi:MAG: hypothetical protein J5629_08590 [Muribaculaceae bacterium]|nr:hypothetical protein [Muribaculaceae bacterium]